MQDAIRCHRTGGSHADAEDVRSADFLLFSPVQLPVQSVQYGHPDVQQKTLRCRLPSGRNFPSFQKRSILCLNRIFTIFLANRNVTIYDMTMYRIYAKFL